MNQTEELEAASQALWRAYLGPFRRAQLRVSHSLAKAEHRMVDCASGPVATWRLGEGSAVMLVHGWGDDHTIWTPLIEQFAARGRAVVTLDLPAHGLSAGEQSALRIATNAIHAVAKACGPIDAIVGHSLGGLTATDAISEGLEVDRAVVIGTVSHNRGRRLAEMAKERGYGAEVIQAVRALHAARFGETDMDAGLSGLAARMTIPALIMHSTDDERVPVDDSVSAHEAWQGSELWLTSGPNHRRTARDPLAIARIVEFVGPQR